MLYVMSFKLNANYDVKICLVKSTTKRDVALCAYIWCKMDVDCVYIVRVERSWYRDIFKKYATHFGPFNLCVVVIDVYHLRGCKHKNKMPKQESNRANGKIFLHVGTFMYLCLCIMLVYVFCIIICTYGIWYSF